MLQYQEVLRKKQVVEQDRRKLVEVMGELDEKKRRTLVTACEQVNRDFASIFSTLLPGAQAQLRPPPGQGVLDGLEVTNLRFFFKLILILTSNMIFKKHRRKLYRKYRRKFLYAFTSKNLLRFWYT